MINPKVFYTLKKLLVTAFIRVRSGQKNCTTFRVTVFSFIKMFSKISYFKKSIIVFFYLLKSYHLTQNGNITRNICIHNTFTFFFFGVPTRFGCWKY